MRWPQFTIRWAMTRIVVIAAALAYLVAAEKESRASGCGDPTAVAVTVLILLAILYRVGRLVVFAIRHRS